jgi:uncharacterized membrane protein YqjE
MAELERTAASAPAQTTNADIEGLPALFGRLGDNVMELLDAKFSLLKQEVKEDAAVYTRGVAMIAIGAVIASVGFALVNVAIAFLISTLFNSFDISQPTRYALGFLITGVLYLVVGGILIVVMKNRLAARNPVPNRSVEEIRKDKQWLKNEM